MENLTMSAAEVNRAKLQVSSANKKIGVNFEGEKTNLGKDSFLKLLVTQLKHQDPTKPMEDQQFIAQMAQFSSLEQMSNLNKEVKSLYTSSESMKASALLGKDIEAVNPLNGEVVKGRVQSVFFAENEVRLNVNGHEIDLNSVKAIHQPEEKKIMSGAAASGLNGN